MGRGRTSMPPHRPAMSTRLHTRLAPLLSAFVMALPIAVQAADLDIDCFTMPLPGRWATVPDSIELSTGLEGLEVGVSCVRVKGSPEPQDHRVELMREQLDNEAQYQRQCPSTHKAKVLAPAKRRPVGRLEDGIFSGFEPSDGARLLRYVFRHERSALVAEIGYQPPQQAVVDRFLRDSLRRVRWKPHADWEAAR